MPVKDLYYQKYLKYKNKYLNLLRQTGGAPSPIFITEKGDTITINNIESVGSRVFSVEELKKSNIINTIKLENLIEYYNVIIPMLKAQAKPQDFLNIKTLIFDDNDLSTDYNVLYLIKPFLDFFNNVSDVSFYNCNLTIKTSKLLYEVLVRLTNTVSIIGSDQSEYNFAHTDNEGFIWS
jgi:hypothetical protein